MKVKLLYVIAYSLVRIFMALSDHIALIATATLIIQVVVLFLVGYGYTLTSENCSIAGMQRSCRVAVILLLVTVFAGMIPSFVLLSISEGILEESLTMVFSGRTVHGIAVELAVALGLWLV